jgi:hypothetical protein
VSLTQSALARSQRWGVVDEPTGAKSWVFSDEVIGGIKCDDPLNNTKVRACVALRAARSVRQVVVISVC